MTVKEMAAQLQFQVLTENDALNREILDIFCCDLLSFVMGRAPADSAWVTVMGNINSVAVASLADIACIVLAENAQMDEAALSRAAEQEIAVLRTSLPIYSAAKQIDLLACPQKTQS